LEATVAYDLAVQPFRDEIVHAFAMTLEPRLRAKESLPDVLSGGFALAVRRAQLLGRQVVPLDAEFAFSLFCWWPFKREPKPGMSERLADIRAPLFRGAALADLTALEEAVPDSTLMLSHEDLYQLQQHGELGELFRGRFAT
jgi:hypothetical protein